MQREARRRRQGVALVVGTAVISGVSIYVNSLAVVGIPAGVFAGLKNLLVAMIFVAAILATREIRKLKSLSGRDWMRLAAIGLIGGSIPFLLFFQGLAILAGAQAGGALASFLHKGMFLFVAVLAFVFLKERMDRYLLLAAVLLLTGTFAVLLPALEGPALAYGLILVATAFWAVEITLSKATLKRLGANLVIVGRMGFGALFIAVFLGATGQLGAVVSLDATQWQWVVVTVAFLAAYVGTFYHGLARIDATSATAILVLGSAVTAGVTALAQGIPPSPATSLGIALILLGVAAGVVRALRYREVEVLEPVPVAT